MYAVHIYVLFLLLNVSLFRSFSKRSHVSALQSRNVQQYLMHSKVTKIYITIYYSTRSLNIRFFFLYLIKLRVEKRSKKLFKNTIFALVSEFEQTNFFHIYVYFSRKKKHSSVQFICFFSSPSIVSRSHTDHLNIHTVSFLVWLFFFSCVFFRFVSLFYILFRGVLLYCHRKLVLSAVSSEFCYFGNIATTKFSHTYNRKAAAATPAHQIIWTMESFLTVTNFSDLNSINYGVTVVYCVVVCFIWLLVAGRVEILVVFLCCSNVNFPHRNHRINAIK